MHMASMTHLEHWLRLHGKSRTAFAAELGISRNAVVELATPGAWKKSFPLVRYETLSAISVATGIMPGVLVEDAMGIGDLIDADSGVAAD